MHFFIEMREFLTSILEKKILQRLEGDGRMHAKDS
jgi:hypothetical protein